jgi:SAM-dependent methyltransferase
METETTLCLVCGADDFRTYFNLQDWGYELPGEFRLVVCQACGHIYQTPRPTQTAIGAFYTRDYQPFRRSIAEEPHAWHRTWQHLQWRPRCLQVARLRASGRLLDVGASTGLFLNEMRRYGEWTLAGVELDARAAQYARDSFGLDVFCGQIEDALWQDNSFDVITLWDVLEHLPSPRTALTKIRKLLTDAGWLILSVPNASSIDARLFGPYWIGLDPPRHMSAFTLAGLKRLLTETDFEVEAAYCFYGRYTAFALSAQQWLHAHLHRSSSRRLLERLLFLPVWRYLTLPYFWTLDRLRLGAIITIRAHPKMVR